MITSNASEIYDEDYTLWKHIDNDSRKRIWRIVRQGDKHKTFAGISPGGAIQESRWTYSEGKNIGKINATSPAEQASRDIRLKIKRKLESGLKSDGALPEFDDLDVSWKLPTLANKWKDRKDKLNYPVFVSPKLDGVRCIINKDGIWSRTGKPYITCVHIWKEVKHLFDKMPGLVLDGEIYFHTDNKDNFDRIISLVKKTKPTPADVKEAEILQFWVFDVIPEHNSYTMQYRDRYRYYFDVLLNKKVVDHNIVRPVYQRIANTEEEAMDLFGGMILNGFEGSMIRSWDAVYEHKRINGLIKYKEFQDDEFKIIGAEEGNGNLAGMIGVFIMETLPHHTTESGEPETFRAAPTGTHAKWAEWWQIKDELYGQLATVRFQNLTPRGVPRFGKLRAIRNYE